MKNPSLHYYIPTLETVSFHQIGLKYAEHLKSFGWDVEIKYLEEFEKNHGGALALWHPLLYLTQKLGEQFSGQLQKIAARYDCFVGMEVADTTAISQRFVQWANLECIQHLFLPSNFSIKAFQDCGVTTPLSLVPHGFDPVTPSNKFDFLKEIKTPKALSFMLHDSHRKGWDILLASLVERSDVTFVVKGPSLKDKPFWEQKENIIVINHWLDAADLASLYLNCDFLFSPHRGGAFELNCLEAACYGLPTLTTGFGAVTEYLAAPGHMALPVKNEVPLWPAPNDHCGMGADLVLADVLDCLDDMSQSLSEQKKAALEYMPILRTNYSWKAVTQKLHTILEGLL